MENTRLRSEYPRLLEHMAAVGYSQAYISTTEWFVGKFLELAPGWEGYDDASKYVEEVARLNGGEEYMVPFLNIVRQFDEEGILPRTPEWRTHCLPNARERLCDGLARVLDAYEASPDAASKKGSTVSGRLACAATFLERIEALGRTNVRDVTEADVLAVLVDDDGGPRFSDGYVRQVRSVLAGADHAVDGCGRVAALLPVPKRWRTVPDALTREEELRVVAVLEDDDGRLSLRDRAIGSVLYHTGMRTSDIADLRMDAIDWRADTVTFAQRKTGGQVTLPLTAPVGNAIFDYVTRERGRSDCPRVFLSKSWPYGEMTSDGVRNVARLVLDLAGVERRRDGRRGSHIFRRTVASAMLRDGANRQVVASVLGHESPKTTEAYMSADVERLRALALDVSAFPVREGAMDDDR